MKLLISLLLLVSSVFAETFVLTTEQIHVKGSYYWIITLCKDDYRYTIIKDEPLNMLTLQQEFENYKGKSVPSRCPQDINNKPAQ